MNKERIRKNMIKLSVFLMLIVVMIPIFLVNAQIVEGDYIPPEESQYVYMETEGNIPVPSDPSPNIMEVDYIDVGQGDATLITCGDHAIMIDAGDIEKSSYLNSYLKKRGIQKIDLFVVTHFHNDHSGGAPMIINLFDVDTLLLSDFISKSSACMDVLTAANENSLSHKTPSFGSVYNVGDMEITIIAPAYNEYEDNVNNSSIGLIVRYGDTSFLFTGDCEEEAEEAILKRGMDIHADVYQAGHHGNATASTSEFLKAVNPDYAVISCGANNSDRSPHAETLERFKSMDIEIFRTDEQGTVCAYSDGRTITWNCEPSQTWNPGVPVAIYEEESSYEFDPDEYSEEKTIEITTGDMEEEIPLNEYEESTGYETETTEDEIIKETEISVKEDDTEIEDQEDEEKETEKDNSSVVEILIIKDEAEEESKGAVDRFIDKLLGR